MALLARIGAGDGRCQQPKSMLLSQVLRFQVVIELNAVFTHAFKLLRKSVVILHANWQNVGHKKGLSNVRSMNPC